MLFKLNLKVFWDLTSRAGSCSLSASYAVPGTEAWAWYYQESLMGRRLIDEPWSASYAPTRCPHLHPHYAMPGTDMPYGAARVPLPFLRKAGG
eukprot:1487060-Rhodomonas_salina.2